MAQPEFPPRLLKLILFFIVIFYVSYLLSSSILPDGFLALVSPGKGTPVAVPRNTEPLLEWTTNPAPCANNTPPVPLAFSEPAGQVTVNTPVLFNALGSSDQGGSITTYSWNFGDGSNGSGSTAVHSYTTTGNKTITLTVTDNCGAAANFQIHLNVVALDPCSNNVLPTTDFFGPTAGSVNYPQRFDASESDDTDGNITNYAWNFGDGTTGTGATATHTYASLGNYDVTLTVTDNCGGVDVETTSINITPTNVSISEDFVRQFPGVRIWGPTVADVDGNGHSEIFALGINGRLYGLDSSGNDLPNFPVDLVARSGVSGGSSGIVSSTRVTPMSIADLNNDGLLELLPIIQITSGSDFSNRLLVLNYDGTLASFWPNGGRDLGSQPGTIPAVLAYDLDHDGTKELITKGFGRNANQVDEAKLFVFRLNGELFNSHYPIIKSAAIDGSDGVLSHNLAGSPAIGDLDGDGEVEIVFNLGEAFFAPPETSELPTTRLHAVHYQDASELPGWPKAYASPELSRQSPVLGDFDNNGSLNVMFIGHENYDPPFGLNFHRAVINVLEPDSADLAGWPQRPYVHTNYDEYCIGDNWIHSPSAADLDHNGTTEIIFICSFNAGTGLTFIYESSGVAHPPVIMEHLHSHEPWNWLIDDIEPGGDLELVYAVEGENDGTIPTGDDIYIYRSDLSLLPGMPIGLHPEWNRQGIKSMPATIADLQRDGQSDLLHIKSYDGSVQGSELRVFDFGGNFNSPGSWPTFHHDNSRTGLAE